MALAAHPAVIRFHPEGELVPQFEGIVAVGLLTSGDLARLGAGFRRAFPVSPDVDFDELLRRIDEADALSRRGVPPRPQG